LQELHGGVERKHLSFDITMRKTLDVSYWLLTMNQDVHEYCRICDQCQKTSNLLTQNLAKLVTTLHEEPFFKWGLDFTRPIKPASN
jgi:Leu/Phe-tRNA-protein transferase